MVYVYQFCEAIIKILHPMPKITLMKGDSIAFEIIDLVKNRMYEKIGNKMLVDIGASNSFNPNCFYNY